MLRLLPARFRSLHMMMVVTAFAAVTMVASAHPKPLRVPTRWELNFTPGELRLFVDSTNTPYWYFSYKVVNTTGKDRFWAPRFTLFTDAGEIMNSGENVPPAIEQTLLHLLGNDLMQRQNQVIGKIFVGEANAIEGLVVWPASRLDVTEMTMFVHGLSGETAEVINPVTDERTVLQKTLMRQYVVPGDPLARGDDPIDLASEEWVMR